MRGRGGRKKKPPPPKTTEEADILLLLDEPDPNDRATQLKQNVIGAWTGMAPYNVGAVAPPPTPAKPAAKPMNRSQSQQTRRPTASTSRVQPPTRNTQSSLAVMKRKSSESGGEPNSTSHETAGNAAGDRKSARRRRRQTIGSAAISIDQSLAGTSEPEEPPLPKPAWQQFSEHIKTFSTSTSYTSAVDNPELQRVMEGLLDRSGSDICKKILKDMKDQLERKRAKELQKALEAEAANQMLSGDSTILDDEDSSDEDSEDEEEYERKKRKAEAQRHWGIIRRDIQEKIRIRKEKNPAGGTWNALRSQLRAMTRADNVRKELYEKYGIIAKDGEKYPEDSMKPKLSIDVKDVVNKFHSQQIRRLRVTFS